MVRSGGRWHRTRCHAHLSAPAVVVAMHKSEACSASSNFIVPAYRRTQDSDDMDYASPVPGAEGSNEAECI